MDKYNNSRNDNSSYYQQNMERTYGHGNEYTNAKRAYDELVNKRNRK